MYNRKSNGSTTYATRDLAAILYRARTYDFDKALYLTSYEQVLHFKQVFEVAKLLGIDKNIQMDYNIYLLEWYYFQQERCQQEREK